jgi:hypothetical protein
VKVRCFGGMKRVFNGFLNEIKRVVTRLKAGKLNIRL